MARPSTAQRLIDIGTSFNVGAKRTLLEDRCEARTLTAPSGLTLTIGVIADGIGSANAGERAAEIAIETILRYCAASQDTDIAQVLRGALEQANRHVYTRAKQEKKKGMGTTAAVAAIEDNRLYIANVGDSRIYLLRGRKITQLTIDHTWTNEYVRAGKLKASEAEHNPNKDKLVRSIGYEPTLEVDLGLWLRGGAETDEEAMAAQGLELQPGDRVLLCSDGLIKSRHDNPSLHYAEPDEIAKAVHGVPAKKSAEDLVKLALARKVDDNVSVVILEVPGGRRVNRALIPSLVIAGAALTCVIIGAIVIPRLARAVSSPSSPTATISPLLPSGQAIVSDVVGQVQVNGSPLNEELTLVAGIGTVIQTGGDDAYVKLGLADGSFVYIGPDTLVELQTIAEYLSQQDTILILRYGRLLVHTDPATQSGFVITTSTTDPVAYARLRGAVMGVEVDKESRNLDADCFKKQCEIGWQLGGDKQVLLQEGQHALVDSNGNIRAVDNWTRNERYAFDKFGEGLIATPTRIPSNALPTRTITSTITPSRTRIRASRTFTPISTGAPNLLSP